MRTSIKKVISLILVFTLLFSMSYSAFAAAAEDFAGVSVVFKSDKKQYKSGEEIKLKTSIKNPVEEKQYVSITYSATPLIKIDAAQRNSIKYAEFASGESKEFNTTAKANHYKFNAEWLQKLYDALFGAFWSAVYMIRAMFNNALEVVSIKVDGIPAVILAQVDACLTLPEEPTKPDEPVIPTDPADPTDTDNDGFTDYEEIYIMGTDPKVKNDPAADTDGDGLTDGDEVHKYKTDINSKDTDGDGLSDYEEVFTYHTDPLKDDTDGDGLSDKFEVNNKLDPTKTSTDGKTKDSEVKIEQTLSDISISENLKDESNCAIPSISGLVNGEIDKNVFISTTTDCTVDDNRAIIGKPAYVDSKDEYINGLTLSFDISKYKGDKSTLSICIVNEDGTYDVVESESKDSEISCKLNKVGTYFVMDIEEFLKNLGVDLTKYNAPKKLMSRAASATSDDKEVIISGEKVSGQADIVFAIDTTGSMSDEVKNVISNITDFTNRLATQYNVKVNYALIDFKDLEEDGAGTTKVVKNGYSNWYSDTAPFIEKLKAIDIDGGGDDDECDIDALETARRLDWRASSSKFIILITDADYKVANDYGLTSMEEEVELLAKDGIVTSVVTDSSFEESYRSVYETTGGLYANIYGNFSEVLLKLADLIGEETSDGEWVILKHGYRYIKLPKLPEKDSATDTDKDGLTDAYELGEAETIDLTLWITTMLAIKGIPASEYVGKKTITVYNAVSDPSINDTDNDGILDNTDTAPWNKGLKDGIVGALKLCSHGEDNNTSGNKLGHAYVAYTSFVNDSVNLYGILVTSSSDTAGCYKDVDYDKIKNPPEFNSISLTVEPNSVITIGSWAGWLAKELRGTWINQELQLYKDETPSTQHSIQEYLTYSDVQKLDKITKNNSKWTTLYNCSAFAVDLWNDITDDNISAGLISTPYNLINSIKKRENYKVNAPLRSEWPAA